MSCYLEFSSSFMVSCDRFPPLSLSFLSFGSWRIPCPMEPNSVDSPFSVKGLLFRPAYFCFSLSDLCTPPNFVPPLPKRFAPFVVIILLPFLSAPRYPFPVPVYSSELLQSHVPSSSWSPYLSIIFHRSHPCAYYFLFRLIIRGKSKVPPFLAIPRFNDFVPEA